MNTDASEPLDLALSAARNIEAARLETEKAAGELKIAQRQLEQKEVYFATAKKRLDDAVAGFRKHARAL